MESELQISFFHCCDVSQQTVISVSGKTGTRYVVMERVLRRFKRWITVTAEWFRRTVTRKVCAFVRSAVCTSGVQRLHQNAILRI